MAPRRYVIEGIVVHENTRQPLAGLRVEAWDKDLIIDDLVGSAVTDQDGRFSMAFDSTYFRELFFDRRPDVFFRIYDGDRLVHDTLDSVIRNLRGRKHEFVIEIDPPRPSDPGDPEPEEPQLDRDAVLALHDVSGLTPAELKSRNAELFEQLQDKALAALRQTLNRHFETASDALRQHVGALDLRPLTSQDEPIKAFLRSSLSGNAELDTVRREGLVRIEELQAPATLAGLFQPDIAIERNLLFEPELRKASTYRLCGLAGLDEQTVEHLIKDSIHPDNLTQEKLRGLVDSGTTSEETARSLGLSANLYLWTGGQLDLMATILDRARDPQGNPAQDLRDVARSLPTQSAILDAWTASGATPPDGADLNTAAAEMAATIQRLFPHEVFKAQQRPPASDALASDLDRVEPLLSGNPDLFGRGRDRLALDGVDSQSQDAALNAYASINRLVNRYPGLGLADVLNASQQASQQKVEEVTRRVALMGRFYGLNPSAPFLTMNTLPGGGDLDGLDFGDMAEDERDMVLATVRSQQRMWRVTGGNAEHTVELMEAGYHDAASIVEDTRSTFIANTEMDPLDATRYWAEAEEIAKGAIARFGTLLDETFGGFAGIEVTNVSAEVEDHLRRMPGYADFVGSQAHCHCRHCQSIISPAAYFVDLMEFIETHITRETFGNARPSNTLSLWQRRRDLWDLTLSCECTETLVPYLTIINEILENYAYRHLEGLDPHEALPERRVIEDAVYAALYSAESLHSFRQPFMLPLERLTTYLTHFPITRAEIAATVLRDVEDAAAMQPQSILGLSQREYDLLRNAESDAAVLNRLYGHSYSVRDEDVQHLLQSMSVTRDEFTQLIDTQFVRAAGVVTIRGARRSPGSVQIDIEYADGLTTVVLDRLHRFVRLWRRLPWSIGELDLVLRHMAHAGLVPADGTLDLSSLSTLLSLQGRLKASVEDLCALFDGLPATPVEPGGRPLLDRLFNLPPFAREVGWPLGSGDDAFLHPAFDRSEPTADTLRKQQRLLAGLNLDDDTLVTLIGHLRATEGLEPAGEIRLNAEMLGRLYRHVRIAALLRLPVPELIHLLVLADGVPNDRMDGLTDLHSLIEFHDWWKGARISLDDLAFVTGGTPRDADAYPTADRLLDRVQQRARDSQSLVFTDTVLALVNGVSEEQSRTVIALNARGLFVPDTTDAASVALTIPSDVLSALGLAAPEPLITEIRAWISANQRPRVAAFLDDALAGVGGMSDMQSSAVILANPTVFQPVTPRVLAVADTSGYRLAAAADLSSLSLGSVVGTLPPADLADLLRAHLAAYQEPGAPAFTGTVFSGLGGLSDDESRAVVAANPSLFEMVVDESQYWLTPEFSPDTALIIPPGIALPERTAHAQLAEHHVGRIVPTLLAGEFGPSADRMDALIRLAGQELAGGSLARAWVTYLQGADTGSPPLGPIVDIHRLAVLFADRAFSATALDFLLEHAGDPAAAIPVRLPFRNPTIAEVRTVFRFRRVLPADGDDLASLGAALAGFGTTDSPPRFAESSLDALAQLLGAERGLVSTLNRDVRLPGDDPATAETENRALQALAKLRDCVELAQYLGVGGQVLPLIVSADYVHLAQAADALYAAFRTKYSTEEEWETRIEPFEDRIREWKRDALSDHIIRSVTPDDVEPDRFKTTNDLYHWFLIDTQLEGCARTSKVVAGISSLQLYVQRCLMNLEQSRNGLVRVQVNPDAAPQWVWRKNYRVWEANRKVFLWPENYIEPDLRDNKTPLFEELESELLQKDINAQSVMDSYAKYLSGLDEIAHLKIAGAYHDHSGTTDVLHLFGVTASKPLVHYYRTVENVYRAERSESIGVVWNPWRRVEIQVPVRQVSPIVFNGRLFVFWVEVSSRPVNDMVGGNTQFARYRHTMQVKFTGLRLDGTWTPPQQITLRHEVFGNTDGVVVDPLIEPIEMTALGTFLEGLWRAEFPGRDFPDNEETEFLVALLEVVRSRGTRILDESFVISTPNMTYRDFRLGVSQLRNLFVPQHDGGDEPHLEPVDDYTLAGYKWERVYPGQRADDELMLVGRDFLLKSSLDFHELLTVPASAVTPIGIAGLMLRRRPLPPGSHRLKWRRRSIHKGLPHVITPGEEYAEAAQMLRLPGIPLMRERAVLANLDPATHEVSVVNGSLTDGVIDANGDLFYLHAMPGEPTHVLKRLGTTLGEPMVRTLFASGVDGLLDIRTQEALQEDEIPFSFLDLDLLNDAKKAIDAGIPDFTGSLGTYFREVFFHIPFLIANHLNSRGKFADAQRWYHYIFDPTFNEDLSGLTASERARRERDRVWMYAEFRNHDPQSLDRQLRDAEAIERYSRDPFNPHAIARLRLGAYKKAVVMKYIDNLLDWGDHLFAQDTMESIGEATLLYVMAADLLGERPPELGDCQEEAGTQTYQSLSDRMAECDDELSVTEDFGGSDRGSGSDYGMGDPSLLAVEPDALTMSTPLGMGVNFIGEAVHEPAEEESGPAGGHITIVDAPLGGVDLRDAQFHGNEWTLPEFPIGEFLVPFSTGLRRQACVFCIPFNEDLRAYWDRVQDRLYKIRNCLNISGIRRQLPLFAPEIDPRLLVRARAAGLTLDDVLDAGGGHVPPYRFNFLLAKAKEYAAALQAFGGALLGALEKKDAEDLARLRLVHQENILKLTTRLRDREIEAAEASLEALRRRQKTVTRRRDHYRELIDRGLSDWEHSQAILKLSANGLRGVSAIISAVGAGFSAFPSILGLSYATPADQGEKTAASWANVFSFLGTISAVASDLTGLYAGFERRQEGWKFSRAQATSELEEIEKQIEASEIRREIAIHAREIHETTIAQFEETLDFYQEKFSTLGLYTWLSTSLQRLHRQAFQNALTMARQAERAFRFERGDDTTSLLGGDYWSAEHAGLLAGERLASDLREMERLYLDTHDRGMEIDQAFSLTQIAPAALLSLKSTGECSFTVPEFYFDLFYPGQYRRRLKSARLTIPCITGPYTNVSATLSLSGSQIRKDPEINDDPATDRANLVDVPPSRSVRIATSTAQNDAGVFRLDFRDERYMPFEGAGAANSDWHLALPKTFRPFDYATINDVILHLSYTAEYDSSFREQVEGEGQRLEEILVTSELFRLYSLRQEFSGAFHQLLHEGAGTDVRFELSEKHFPLFLQGRQLEIARARLVLEIDKDRMVDDTGAPLANDLNMTVTGNRGHTDIVGFEVDESVGLPSSEIHPGSSSSGSVRPIFDPFRPASEPLTVTLRVNSAGNFAPTGPAPSDPSALDETKIKDVFLYMEYRSSRSGSGT